VTPTDPGAHSDAPQAWLEVGRVGRPHGLRGDALVTLSTDRPERLDPGTRLRAGSVALEVARSQPYQDRWLVHFVGVDHRDAIEPLRGVALQAEALDEPDTLWVHTVVGAEVLTPDGVSHGRVASVLANPAHDLLVLDDDTLVPVVFIVQAESTDDRLVVDAPEGLFP